MLVLHVDPGERADGEMYRAAQALVRRCNDLEIRISMTVARCKQALDEALPGSYPAASLILEVFTPGVCVGRHDTRRLRCHRAQ